MKTPAYNIGTAAIIENLLKRRWSAAILRHLSNGPTDPAGLCKLEPELKPTAVNERIRTMVRYSLITRRPNWAANKTVLYELTDRGRKLLRMLDLIERLDEFNEPAEIVLAEPPLTPPPVRTAPVRPTKRARRTVAASSGENNSRQS